MVFKKVAEIADGFPYALNRICDANARDLEKTRATSGAARSEVGLSSMDVCGTVDDRQDRLDSGEIALG